MIIKLSPIVYISKNKKISVYKKGDILTINNDVLDFGFIGEGDILPRDAITSDYVCGDVERIKGQIVITVVYPISIDAKYSQRFPEPIIMNDDGGVKLP